MRGHGEYHAKLSEKTLNKIYSSLPATFNQLLENTGLSKSTLNKWLERLQDEDYCKSHNLRVVEKRRQPFGEEKRFGDFVEEGVSWEVRDWLKSPKRRKAILRYHKHFKPKHIKRKGESAREHMRRIRKLTKPVYTFKFKIIHEKESDN